MTAYQFIPADPHSQMAAVFDGLTRSSISQNHKPGAGWFHEAMAGLIGIEVSLAAGRSVPDDELNDFRNEVVKRIHEQPREFYGFIARTDSRAEDAHNEGWYRASLGRSVIQILLDNYPGIEDLIDPDDVREIDELLRQAVPEAPPVLESLIPPGLPESHWWWTAPAGPPWESPDPDLY